ncbi:MAG: hypothetical protein HGA45_21680 [Chloroflexales bacterium]|nr:hypothetical protein [Chloroflexales bacterium]
MLRAQPALPAGTRDVYPTGHPGFRANIEWRTSTYGGEQLYRRTLWKTFLEQGEFLLLASSAVGVTGTPNEGDILVFNPGRISGRIGRETIPDTADFSCVAQRAAPGEGDRGRIDSRAAELGGPNIGYRPCFYQAPATGIYDVVILGPEGRNSNREINPSGQVEASGTDFGPEQATAITAWDISVADTATATAGDTKEGRSFVYYFALLTGGNSRPIYNEAYVATHDGFIYKMSTRGADPFGFVFYSNQRGFLNTDGNPLYRDVMAQPDLADQDQNQLLRLQGDVRLAPPEHPIFIQPPDPAALAYLGIPPEPITPVIADLTFQGPTGTAVTGVGLGGTFSFDLTGGSGIYYLVISRDGVNFDPTLPQNRVLYGNAETRGRISVVWDGRDNERQLFPTGDSYRAALAVQGGEVHFPALDIENNLEGSVVRLLNPPGGICPPFEGGCASSFYDDRGYRTANGTLVGVSVNGPLCPGNVGNPPAILFSDPLRGYDSTSNQRGWGFTQDGNPPQLCDPVGGFGDKKGLDRWAYYPSSRIETPLRIVEEATAVTLVELTAAHTAEGILVRWTTGAELGSRGFYLYRGATGERGDATLVTPALLPARGSPSTGASYRWLDRGAAPATAYTYWLVEVESDGQTRDYPPVQALPLAAAPAERVFLPTVSSR